MAGLGVKQYAMSGMGVFGYTAYIDSASNDISGMIISMVVSAAALAAGFILVYITYKDDEPVKKQKTSDVSAAASAGSAVASPVKGDIVALEDVKDEVFSTGAMGKVSRWNLTRERSTRRRTFDIFPYGHGDGAQRGGACFL